MSPSKTCILDFPCLCLLTSFLGGELHCVAGRTLKAVVGHHHVQRVFRVGHQITEDPSWLGAGAVETFGLFLLIDHQSWNQTGFT